MTSLHEASSGSSGGSPEKAPAPDDDDASIDAPEGFDEIENAFARVSLVADALLDSIQDDDLRGEERKRERRRQNSNSPRRNSPMASRSRTPTNYVTDSDDDGNNHIMMKEDDEDHQVNLHTQSYHLQQQQQQQQQDDHHYGYHSNNNNYGGDESDISTLGDMTFGEEDESMDGSLINDVANLKSVTRAMRAEMQKQEEAFHANVTHSSPQTFFQKLEKDDDEANKTPRIKNHSLAVNNNRPTTIISVRNNKTANGGQVVPVLISTRPMRRRSSVMKQLQRLCHQYLGSKPNLPLLVANLLVWVCFFKLVWSFKDNLLDGEGRLRVAFAS